MLRIAAFAAAVALLATAAHAQDMTGVDITALVKGKTVYLELPGGPRGKGTAILVYGDDNKSAAKFPNGTSPKGTWAMKDNTICTTWEDQANNPCTIYRKTGDKIDLINVENGQPRGTIVRIAPGNPEKL